MPGTDDGRIRSELHDLVWVKGSVREEGRGARSRDHHMTLPPPLLYPSSAHHCYHGDIVSFEGRRPPTLASSHMAAVATLRLIISLHFFVFSSAHLSSLHHSLSLSLLPLITPPSLLLFILVLPLPSIAYFCFAFHPSYLFISLLFFTFSLFPSSFFSFSPPFPSLFSPSPHIPLPSLFLPSSARFPLPLLPLPVPPLLSSPLSPPSP